MFAYLKLKWGSDVFSVLWLLLHHGSDHGCHYNPCTHSPGLLSPGLSKNLRDSDLTSFCISKAKDVLPLRAKLWSQSESITVYPQQFCWIFRGSRSTRIFREHETEIVSFLSRFLLPIFLSCCSGTINVSFAWVLHFFFFFFFLYLHADQSPVSIPLTSKMIISQNTPPTSPHTCLIFNYTLLNTCCSKEAPSSGIHHRQAWG